MKKLLFTVLFAAAFGVLAAQKIDREINVDVTGKLYGSVVIPHTETPVPVVLFISGSGPTDRDGNSLSGIKSDYIKMMSRELYDAGIASVRYDKRIGLTHEKDATFEHFIDDAIAWVDLLAANEAFSDITIVGHSEGATIGAMAAIKSPKVDRVVYLCGMTEGIAETLKKQLKAQETSLGPLAQIAYESIDSLQQGYPVVKVPKELNSLFRPSVQPFLISLMKYMPEEYIARVPVPILLVHGTTDLQVPSDGQAALAAMNPKARAITIKDMNHTLKKTAATDIAGQQEFYANPDIPLHEELMPAIIGFIKE